MVVVAVVGVRWFVRDDNVGDNDDNERNDDAEDMKVGEEGEGN